MNIVRHEFADVKNLLSLSVDSKPIIKQEALEPVPATAFIIVPGSIVKVTPSTTDTLPSSVHILSEVNVVLEKIMAFTANDEELRKLLFNALLKQYGYRVDNDFTPLKEIKEFRL